MPDPTAVPSLRRRFRDARQLYVAQRREAISRHYLNGWTMSEIAAELRLNVSTISREIGAIIDEYQRQTRLNVHAMVAVELKKINDAERQAMEAYERSRHPKRIATAGKVDAAGRGETTTAHATSIERDEGDPRLLLVAAKCRDQRARLLRLHEWTPGQPDGKKSDNNKEATTLSDWILAHEQAKKSLPPPKQ